MNATIGIDPGLDGYIAWIRDGFYAACPIPVLPKGKSGHQYDEATMVAALRTIAPVELAVVEKQQAMPGQGVSSMFAIGHGFGLIKGILAGLGIPYLVVHPRTWQKVMLRDAAGTDTKSRSIIVAGRLFPNVDLRRSERAHKPCADKADALLLAHYGQLLLQGQTTTTAPPMSG